MTGVHFKKMDGMEYKTPFLEPLLRVHEGSRPAQNIRGESNNGRFGETTKNICGGKFHATFIFVTAVCVIFLNVLN